MLKLKNISFLLKILFKKHKIVIYSEGPEYSLIYNDLIEELIRMKIPILYAHSKKIQNIELHKYVIKHFI